MPPKKNGDYAFLLHILRSMKSTGQGAVILPHGVLFRGGAEGEIRKNIIRKGYIQGIIGLPANLFYGTGIPACIIVLDKENAAGRKGIFMINASQGFMKDGNKNRLRHQDIHKIVDVFTRQLEIPKYSRMVPLAEISDPKNDYNLNIPRYIDNTEEEDAQDIAAHLLGGIPNRDIERLAAYWDVFKTLRGELFADGARPGYSRLSVETQDIASLSMNKIKSMIFAHPEFVEFTAATTARFKGWMDKNRPLLSALDVGSRPKALIETLSEDLLATFSVQTQDIAPVQTQDIASLRPQLIDPYDLYQHLMTYCVDIMQDDVYMLVTEGWIVNPELIPPALLIARYFQREQAALEKLRAEQEALTAQMDELDEEHGGEDGLLQDARNDKGKITKASLKAYLKEIENDADVETQHIASLANRYLQLIEQAAEAGKKARDAQKALDDKVSAHYAKLTLNEIKALVIDDKWLATLAADVDAQTQAIATQFAARIKELAERYAAPLPQLTGDVETLTSKVDAHLKKMGFAWK
jgi:type I restriction enzyme M protein